MLAFLICDKYVQKMNNDILINGQLISKLLAEYATYNQLDQNIDVGWPNTTKRQFATNQVSINTIEFVPYIGTKVLHVKSTSKSTNNNVYNQSVQFLKVNFNPSEDSTEVAEIEQSDQSVVKVETIDLNTHNIKCRCSCLDFRFRFAFYNNQDKALVGQPPPRYIRKTTTKPPVNPLHLPGMCKHILKLIDNLRDQRIVK